MTWMFTKTYMFDNLTKLLVFQPNGHFHLNVFIPDRDKRIESVQNDL